MYYKYKFSYFVIFKPPPICVLFQFFLRPIVPTICASLELLAHLPLTKYDVIIDYSILTFRVASRSLEEMAARLTYCYDALDEYYRLVNSLLYYFL